MSTITPARTPVTKAARQAKIIQLLEQHRIRSQGELADRLAAEDVAVNQGTLSRDLLEVGAVRVRGPEGHLVYAVPGEGGDRTPQAGEYATFETRLIRVCAEILVSAEASANLAVLRTPPGAAQYFASAVDKVAWAEVLGTIAGDDTVVVITRDPLGGAAIARRFLDLSTAHRPTDSESPRTT